MQVVIYLLEMAHFFDLFVTFEQKWSGLRWLLALVGGYFPCLQPASEKVVPAVNSS